ncbi:MAG: methyltransferase family protein [bacterium]
MNSLVLHFKTGRFIWTIVVSLYFLVFFTNFFVDAMPEHRAVPLICAYLFVLWLAVEYYFGSPFFQSGVVAPPPVWRGVFAFFVYPYILYVNADFIWWHWTQIPVNHLITGILGLIIFGGGIYLRLVTLFGLIRIAQVKPGSGELVFPVRRFLELKWQKICRHPRYLATLMQLIGIGLVFRSWGGLILVLMLGLPLILIQAHSEEKALAQILKSEFQQFRRVAMLFPHLVRKN